MLDLALLSLALFGAVLWRIVLSRPPKRGIPGGRASIQAAHPAAALARDAIAHALPHASRVLGAPPSLPLDAALVRAPVISPPAAPLSLVGLEVDRGEDERQLWLLARERLAHRAGRRPGEA